MDIYIYKSIVEYTMYTATDVNVLFEVKIFLYKNNYKRHNILENVSFHCV